MKPRHFSSFEEIDTQLKILKLEREIEKEQLVLNYKKVKYLLYPQKIAKEVGDILHQRLINLLLNRFSWLF